MKRQYILAAMAASLLILLACAGAEATPEPTATSVPLTSSQGAGAPETSEPEGAAGGAASGEDETADAAAGDGEATITPTPPVAPGQPTRQMDAHVEVSISSTEPKVGDLITISARAVDVGLPKFSVMFSTGGMIRANADNTFEVETEDPLFEVISVQVGGPMVTLVLKTLQAGSTVITIYAEGEIAQVDEQGNSAYTWSGGGSDQIEITITE